MTTKKPKLFGTSGVRGVTNIEITPELAMKLSKAFGRWLGGSGKVIIGRDTRFGAQMLTASISAGLNSVGLDTVDCGILPTPALAQALLDHNGTGGVMVTGSHMPPNRIGLIYMDPSASYISDEKALEVEDIFFKMRDEGEATDKGENKAKEEKGGKGEKGEKVENCIMDSIGTGTEDRNCTEKYIARVNSMVDRNKIAELGNKNNFRVVLDPGNGTAVDILPSLVNGCGIETINLNNVQKGNPDRAAEPRAGTLGKTIECVRKHGAQLGAATDVDADRVVFIDETGEAVSEDVIGAILGKWVFQGARRDDIVDPVCVTPVNSSGLIEYLAADYGVKVEFCKIGQPDTERVLGIHGERAVYAYEESGKYYFARDVHWSDGNLATLVLLQIMAEKGKTLGEMVNELPRFFQSKGQYRCSDAVKKEVYRRVEAGFRNDPLLSRNKLKDITIDGLKRIYNDNSWLLVRPSGTEPLFRIYSDAMSKKRADELVAQGAKLVLEAIKF